jgi:NHL repeat
VKSPRTWVALFGRSDSSTTGVDGSTNSSGRRGAGIGVRPGAPNVILLAVAATAILGVWVAIGVSAASAAVVRGYESAITQAGSPPTAFGTLNGLTVDSTGNLYVADGGNHAVDKFDSSSAPVAAWGTGGQLTEAGAILFSNPFGLAVDNSDSLWASDLGNGAVYKLSPSGALELQGEGPEAGGAFPESGHYIQSLAWDNNAARLFVADSAFDQLFALESTGTYKSTLSEGLGGGSSYIRAAADNSGGATDGDVYVATGTAVVRIDPAGTAVDFAESGTLPYVTENTITGTPDGAFGPNALVPSAVGAIAVDSTGDLYVADVEHHRVDEFTPSGKYLGKLTGTPTGPGGVVVPFGEIAAIGVNAASGKLYVADKTAAKVDVFSSPFVAPDVTTTAPSDVATTSATFNGEVNPDGIAVTECAFEYGETEVYGQTAACETEGGGAIGGGTTPVTVHADVAGLHVGVAYHYRLIAGNANGVNKESGDQSFFTGATIVSTSVSGVSATAATLLTEINPNGVATSFHFEYDTRPYAEGEAAHGISTPLPPAPLGAGSAAISRASQIQGLQALTTYYFRVVAESTVGSIDGPDRSFTTQGAAASVLPDERGWEMVSPPDKGGIPLEALTEEGGVIQAAADGRALAYIADGAIDQGANGSLSFTASQLLAKRSSTGWDTTDITTPHKAPAGLFAGILAEYKAFSTNLDKSAVEPLGSTPLSAQATERTPYLRSEDGTFIPLASESNVPHGIKFGGEEILTEQFTSGVEFVTATPDLSSLYLRSPQALTGDFGPSFAPSPGVQSLYRWRAGQLTLSSWIPSAPAARCGGGGPACLPAAEFGQSVAAGSRLSPRDAVSTSGSRVIFSSGESGLYLRDLDREETVLLDAPQGGAGKPSGGSKFQFANEDDSRIFFTDSQPLTAISTAVPGKPDLYLCEIALDAAGHLACALTDITANAVNSSEPANVLGTVLGGAEDGSVVYFVAQGALTLGEGAVKGNCVAPQKTGECNLYSYSTATKSTRLIAVLSAADSPDWCLGGNECSFGELTARVSPNGRYLSFMSQGSLTGYDNRDSVSGAADQEVFLYDTQGRAGSGALICASCNPTGARPEGVFDQGVFPGLLADRPLNWGGQTLAGSIPGWTKIGRLRALYQSRYLSDSGRLFFNAADALVPQDSNGVMDVYEYEAPKSEVQPISNSCTTEAPTYSHSAGGCISLISSGTSSEESTFLDASESGDDVFFLTAAQLSQRDKDDALDVYDASVGGRESEPSNAVECSGDACQQPATPPDDSTPGSLTFNGPGNVNECPKGKQLKKGKCVKKKQKKTKKHNKSNKKKAHKKSNKQKNKRTNANRGGAK